MSAASQLLEQRLKRLMMLRVVTISTLLLIGITIEAQSETLRPYNPLYLIIVVTYGLTVIEALALRFLPFLRAQAFAHVVGDLLTATALIYLHGATNRGFILLYPISVLAGAIVLSARRSGLLLAGLATLAYATVLWAVRSGAIPPEGLFDVPFASLRQLLYSVFMNGVACTIVGVVGSYLAESLQTAGERLEKAAEQVADLEELNQLIVSSIHSGLVTATAAGEILFVNDYGASILGRSALDMQGRRLNDVFGSRLLESVTLEARAVDQTLARFELPYVTPDERQMDLGFSVSPLATPGRGYLVVFQDLTDIKRLENEVRVHEKLAAMGEMAATLAHEIRNPLGSISGSAQVLMEDEGMSRDQERLLAIITRESRRLSDTLERFLLQARTDGRPRQPVDLGPLIEESVTLLRNGAEVGDRHEVLFERDAGPHVCLADPDAVAQVFWNLSRNGLEAMPSGGVLSVKLAVDGPSVSLLVRDEGVGMRHEEQQRIFAPFRTGRPGGTGLGLAVVYGIVRDHGGDVMVRSAPARGTEFEVRLPRLDVEKSRT